MPVSAGWGAWIRTKIHSSKGWCAALAPRPSADNCITASDEQHLNQRRQVRYVTSCLSGPDILKRSSYMKACSFSGSQTQFAGFVKGRSHPDWLGYWLVFSTASSQNASISFTVDFWSAEANNASRSTSGSGSDLIRGNGSGSGRVDSVAIVIGATPSDCNTFSTSPRTKSIPSTVCRMRSDLARSLPANNNACEELTGIRIKS